MSASPPPAAVVWHDLECGGYREDLALWSALADAHGGPVLDVGAGTGRVALALARAGHAVIALDREPELLAALAARATGLPIATVRADARDFALARTVPLCVVPMQTIQLLGGAAWRRRFFDCARRALVPGGRLAMAIADRLELFDVAAGFPAPLPDVREIAGTVYCSRALAVRELDDAFVLERRRETVTPEGQLVAEADAIALDRLEPSALEAEGEAAGFAVAARGSVAATDDYVGSTVVMLDA